MHHTEASPTAAPASIMSRLREETAELHTMAEQQPLQQSLARGTLAREDYAAYLGQLLLVHRALDLTVERLAATVPSIGRVFRSEHVQVPYLLEDLAFFGLDPAAINPTPAAAALIARIEETALREPVSLLGFHYVMEGSNNGGRFLAKAIRRSYELPEGAGTRYFDPYGERQREVWQQFKLDMDACDFSSEEADSIVGAARIMFEGIAGISAEVWKSGRR